MRIQEYEFPEDLYYDRNHYWARVEGEVVTQGTTDYAQKMAGQFAYVALPRLGRMVEQGKSFTSVESGKWVGRVYATVTGTIIEVNEELEYDAALINKEPYGRGWIVKIKMSDPKELDNLLRASEPGFEEFMLGEIEKHKRE